MTVITASMLKDQAWKDKVFADWHKLINMTGHNLRRWKRHAWKKLASLSTARAKQLAIYSGLKSLHNIARKVDFPQSLWGRREYTEAVREIRFNTRMLGMSPGRPISLKSPVSKWEISLRNWGHDPRNVTSPGHDKMVHWYQRYYATAMPTAEKTFFHNVL